MHHRPTQRIRRVFKDHIALENLARKGGWLVGDYARPGSAADSGVARKMHEATATVRWAATRFGTHVRILTAFRWDLVKPTEDWLARGFDLSWVFRASHEAVGAALKPWLEAGWAVRENPNLAPVFTDGLLSVGDGWPYAYADLNAEKKTLTAGQWVCDTRIRACREWFLAEAERACLCHQSDGVRVELKAQNWRHPQEWHATPEDPRGPAPIMDTPFAHGEWEETCNIMLAGLLRRGIPVVISLRGSGGLQWLDGYVAEHIEGIEVTSERRTG